jgi:hypothetical protein
MVSLQWEASSNDSIGNRTWSRLIPLAVHSTTICLEHWNLGQVALLEVLQNDLNVRQSKNRDGKMWGEPLKIRTPFSDQTLPKILRLGPISRKTRLGPSKRT